MIDYKTTQNFEAEELFLIGLANAQEIPRFARNDSAVEENMG